MAKKDNTNATIRVQFGSASAASGGEPSGHLSAEIDDRPNGLNNGKNSFQPGDQVAILVYRTPNVTVDKTTSSAGSITPSGPVTTTQTDELFFQDSIDAKLSIPAMGAITSTVWSGNDMGALTVGSDRMSVRAATKGVGVANITYEAQADVYLLTSPDDLGGQTDFTIIVLIEGSSA